MLIYRELAAAMQADDVDGYVAWLDDDFQYVRHTSNDALGRDQMAALLRHVWLPGNRTIDAMRCVYENEDILVMHTCLSFRDGSRQGAMIVHLKRGDKVLRIESGVSDLAR